MSQASAPVRRVVVRVRVGDDRMAATDDPLLLGIEGPGGREFRLTRRDAAKILRRGTEDTFVLAGPDDPETNVRHPELNDPQAPALDATRVRAVYLRKGTEPIPNVRGLGEMDDRLQIAHAEVELHAQGAPKPLRFTCAGPIWLGIVCGERVSLEPDGTD